MPQLLGIGECMVEMSPIGEGTWQQGYAGDVLNAMWYAKAHLPSDMSVGFHSGFGDDPISLQMRHFIEGVGVSCDRCPTIPGRVPGLYMIHLKDGERSFSYWRETSAARQMLNDPEALFARIRQAEIVYLSGITLAILPEDKVDILFAGLRDHLKEGARVAFDPNIRPRLWSSEVRMREVLTRAASLSHIVLPSFDDETMCFGDKTPEDTVARYQELGASLIVVKDGEKPTRVAYEGSVETFDVPLVDDVVDTTAAGDSFGGTFVAELLLSNDPAKAVRAAQACSGKVVGAKGALIPFDQLS